MLQGFGLGLAISMLGGYPLLLLLRRLHISQHAYEDAPQSHQQKTGTPTMGGLIFSVALVVAAALAPVLVPALRIDPSLGALTFLILACAAVGAVDDVLSIRRGRNLGLRARTKFLLTALVAVIFLRWIDGLPVIFARDTLFHAHGIVVLMPHWLWLLLGIVAITGTIHAVNLTDGLDGLATGAILSPFVAFGFVASAAAGPPAAPFVAGLFAGACLGFLLFNVHPAKMFMGDAGSLALGAALSGIAILCGQMLFLALIGGVFVAETVSVILQVLYFKRTRKRIFRMSPLHHHFELGGWPETKVTARFWAASILLSCLGLAIVR